MNGIRSTTFLAALAATALISTASAHPEPRDGGFRGGRYSWSRCDYRVRPAPRVSRYQRGLAAGRRDGWRAGLEDGRYGRACDATPHVRRKHRSRQYIAGYKKGYAVAYERGYRRGQRLQRRRWHWRW